LQVSVTFRHLEPSDPLRDYATEKVLKAAKKYLPNAVDSHVTLTVSKQRHLAEINVHASHFDISAHDCTDDLYSAIDGAISKVEAQLRKHKDRINHHKGRKPTGGDATIIPVDVIDTDDFDQDGAPLVVETDNIPAKPLSVEDAILQLDLSHAEFLVFKNSLKNESISVLYRRRDGSFGLITPNT
jgi:putative sigma-54 modulation protein